MFRGFLLFLLSLAAAHATSVAPVLHECPVCGEKSVATRLMSYSNFGEPARDLSDDPRYRFSNVEICPNDLYAGFPDTWEDMKPAEKTKLHEFLKSPALRLTPEEKKIIAGHEDAFRDSRYFSMLWARTCDDFLTLSPQARLHRILRLHYSGSSIPKSKDAKEWEKRLAAHYREQAIAALKDAKSADWPKPDDKRVFAYLQAEFIRQAGRNDEAHALFQQVIAAESALKDDDEETSWILAWAEEQSLRTGPDTKDPARLITHIIPELPDPWRDEKATENPRWPLHHAAVDILVRKASSGEKPFSDALWNLLDRKNPRLLALLETTGHPIASLRDVDPRWAAWFDEIKALLDQNKLPDELSKDENPERITNVFVHVTASTSDDEKLAPWYVDVLLPAVRKCVVEGGIPSLPVSDKLLYPGLPPSMLDKEAKKETPASLNKLSRALYELWEHLPAGERSDVARIYVRILHKLGDDYDESFNYPVEYFLPEMAGTQEGRDAIRAEFDGPWKSTFWKAASAYAAQMENSGETLRNHPMLSKWGYGLAAKLFRVHKDPSLKETAIKKLAEEDYVLDEVIGYLVSLDLPDTRKALEDYAKGIRSGNDRKRKSEWPEGRLYTLQNLDEAKVQAGLKKIPLR